jgi:hypothetical protein
MRVRGILAAAIVIGMALSGLAGCSKKLRPIQNLPPETYLFVQGPVDTVNHRVHLYWYGTDPDGEVVAYAFRWVYPPPAPQVARWDTIFCAGTPRCTDSLFTMFTGDSGVVIPTFEIYAIDNEDAPDPTPAAQRFPLSNLAPEVRITGPLAPRDSTYGSVTLTWETIDPDGGGPGLRYRIWLDGNEAAYDSTSEQTFTVPSARFLQNNEYRSGPRTVFVQAVDDGGRSGPAASMTWYVRAPAAVLENNQGRLLVVDDVVSTDGNSALYHSTYRGIADLLPEGTYSLLRVESNPGIFRSARDMAQTLRQFKAVLWYRGGQASVSPWLSAYQDSIGAYLDAGGKMYVDGNYLIQGLRTPGALGEEFLGRHLGSTGLLNCYAAVSGGRSDSTAGWTFRFNARFRSSVYGEEFPALGTPFPMPGESGGVRVFAVTDTNFVAVWALEGQLRPRNTGFEAPVGVTVPQGMGGRIILVTFPIAWAPDGQDTNLLRRMLGDFGIGIPLP